MQIHQRDLPPAGHFSNMNTEVGDSILAAQSRGGESQGLPQH